MLTVCAYMRMRMQYRKANRVAHTWSATCMLHASPKTQLGNQAIIGPHTSRDSTTKPAVTLRLYSRGMRSLTKFIMNARVMT